MLLSIDAIAWLQSVNYESKSHEERLKLIEAAKIAYPLTEEDKQFEHLSFMLLLGLA